MKDWLTTSPLPLERPQGSFVLFVGRRYYLRWREVSFWGPQRASLEWGVEKMQSAAVSDPGRDFR